MRYILRFAGLAALFGGILSADIYNPVLYTYTYTGADFDTYCALADYLGGYIPCGPTSGVGNMTGYAVFSQPISPNQTVRLDAGFSSLDYLTWGPPSWGLYGGVIGNGWYANGGGLSLTTNSLGRIVSWDIQMGIYDDNFWAGGYMVDLSSSGGGDSSSAYFWGPDYGNDYIIYSTSTPGTWTADFTPEPTQTPVKSFLLLAALAAIISIRKRQQRPSSHNRFA
jgi:hypothetical protein